MAARRRWKDRTSAFEAGVLARNTRPPPNAPSTSQFLRIAGSLARDLQDTSAKLAELTRLTRKAEVLYAREIAELSGIVKTDIRNLKSQLEDLRRASVMKGQSGQHHELVVASLQTRLADKTKDFRAILAERTAKLERSAAVEAALSGSMGAAFAASPLMLSPPPSAVISTLTSSRGTSSATAGSALISTDSFSSSPFSSSASPNGALSTDLTAPLEALNTQAVQQAYSTQRLQAVESINETMTELHTIFVDLHSLLEGQVELTRRIENNVIESEQNLISSQQQLLDYWRRMSSNRWFVIKLLAILAFFVRRPPPKKKPSTTHMLHRQCSSLFSLCKKTQPKINITNIKPRCPPPLYISVDEFILGYSTLIDW